MAFVEKRGKWYRIIFRYAGQRYTHTLKTTDSRHAAALKGGIENTLMRLEQRLLTIPQGTSVAEFVLSGGKAEPERHKGSNNQPRSTTLEMLKEEYRTTHSIGCMEANSLETVTMHLRHFIATLAANFVLQNLALADVQRHVDRRSKKNYRDRPRTP